MPKNSSDLQIVWHNLRGLTKKVEESVPWVPNGWTSSLVSSCHGCQHECGCLWRWDQKPAAHTGCTRPLSLPPTGRLSPRTAPPPPDDGKHKNNNKCISNVTSPSMMTCIRLKVLYVKHYNTQPNLIVTYLYPSLSPASTHAHAHNFTTPCIPPPPPTTLQQSGNPVWLGLKMQCI